MDAHTRNLPLSSIGANFPHENLDAFWGPYASAESAMVYPVPAGQGFAQGIIPENYRVPGLKFGVKVMNGSQLVRVEEYQVTGVQTYKKLILTEDDINLPQDIAEVFVCHNNAQDYGDLNAAVQAGKIIMWEGNVVNIKHNSTQGVYRLSYVGGDGLVHCYNVFSSSPSAATKENIPLARADEYLYYGSGTTFVELNSWVSSHKPVKVNGYVANVVQDSQTQYTLKYVDGDGVLYIITHDSSNTKTTTTKDLSASVHVEADNSTKVFAIKDNRGTTIGNITLSTAASGAAVLAFADNVNGSFVATLPNLRYDSATQMLKMVDAGENETNLIKLSNLQIKYVGSTDPSTGTWALGDLILVGNDNDGYELKVYTGSAWSPLGSINDVSLDADYISFSSNVLESTNVKDAIEEVKSDISNLQYVVPTWSGYVGASNATTISGLNLNSLVAYSNKSGSVNVQISSTSYLWFVVNREVIAESFGIEIPVQYMGMQNGFYYYKTYEQILPSNIGVELIATDASQSDDSGGGDTPTPTPTAQKPTIVTPPQSATYNEGATPNALTVVARVSDGGTLSFQWYKDGDAFGNAQSGTAVSNGVQSSITPASVTATYYCIITNSLNGATNTNETSTVIITFNEDSGTEPGTEETDLTGFTEGKLDVNGNLVSDSNYVISPKYAVSDIVNNNITIYDGFDNRSSGDPAIYLSVWAGTDESPVFKGKWSKNWNASKITATSATEYNGIKGVFSKSEIDYCFLKIGNTYPFKGCKIQDAFLNKIVDFGAKYNAGVLTNNNTTPSGDTNRANTFVVGPFNLEEGEYYIQHNINGNYSTSTDRVSFFNSDGDYINRYTAAISSFKYENGQITRPGEISAETIPSGSVFYICCAMTNMHECYLMKNGVYLWKGAKVIE